MEPLVRCTKVNSSICKLIFRNTIPWKLLRFEAAFARFLCLILCSMRMIVVAGTFLVELLKSLKLTLREPGGVDANLTGALQSDK